MQLRLSANVSFGTDQDRELTTAKFEKPGASTLGFFFKVVSDRA